MTADHPDVLHRTIAGLEAGLQVRHIATFTLTTCEVDESVEDVFANPDWRDFDQFPVLNESKIVGVLEREKKPKQGPILQGMRPLDDSMLVSAGMPLFRFLELGTTDSYWLVIQGSKIEGIVTRSDMLKLPVRLLAFALITHLEMVMSNAIEQVHGDGEAWMKLLNSSQRGRLKRKLKMLQKEEMDPPLLELTEFSDKVGILQNQFDFGEDFLSDLDGIKKLRNKLSHAGRLRFEFRRVEILYQST